MSYTAKKLIDIAVAEIGYHEKASNSQLDDKYANSGFNNWTKYARDLNLAGYYNGNKNGFDWCAVFVSWCHYMAAGKNKTLAEYVQCQTNDLGAAVNGLNKCYQAQGRYDKNPKVGDQICFDWQGNASDGDHTGIVEKIDNTYVYTIEGNTSNGAVERKKYPLNSPYIIGYGHPKFGASSTTSTGDNLTPTAKVKKRVVDVSEFQLQIDWAKLKKEGCEGAIIRCGYSLTEDAYLKRNIAECEKHGIPYGLYHYSHALTEAAAKKEASFVMDRISAYCGKNFLLGVWWDAEEKSQYDLGSTLIKICDAFINAFGTRDYPIGVYSNLSFLYNPLKGMSEKYPLWVAQYNDVCQYSGKNEVYGWQWGLDLKFTQYPKGIDGDWWYKDFSGKPTPTPDPEPKKKTIDELAQEVIDGKWGTGADRKKRLTEAGYDYNAVQERVNELLQPKTYKVKVTASNGLNCRTGASMAYKVVKAYPYGTILTISETKGEWGKTADGWVCLTYTKRV